MKKLVSLFVILICSFTICAQTEDDIGKIVIGVKIPSDANEETIQMRELLEQKLLSICAQAGFTSFSNYFFYISPNIVIESKDVAEGGMKNVYVIKGQLYLSIQDGFTVYSSTSIPFNGSATTAQKALRNAISSLDLGKMKDVLFCSKEKIMDYFLGHKTSVFAKADAYASSNQYDEAITTLMMIPEDITDMYQEALAKASIIYEQKCKYENELQLSYRRQMNSELLVKASSLLANHEPGEALNVLSDYQEGDNTLDRKYNELLAKAENLVSANERKEAAIARQNRHDRLQREAMSYNLELKNVDLQKQKINAMKTVACTYLRNNPSFRYYQFTNIQTRLR